MDDTREITAGSRFLSPTGRIWTVRTITPKGARVELTSDGPDGEHGAVMDLVAVLRMVRIDQREPASTPDVEYEETQVPDLTRA